VDREAADVAAVRVADDQEQALARRQVLGREPVDTAREKPTAVRSHGGALVLDESRRDLPIPLYDARRVEAGEVLPRTTKLRPDHQPILLTAEELVPLLVLQALVLERGVPGGQDEPMERRNHADAVARGVHHAPFGIERLGGDRAGADPDRVAPRLRPERERGGGVHRGSGREQSEETGDRERVHLVSPTTTRLKVDGEKYLAATSWTSRTVTRPMRSL